VNTWRIARALGSYRALIENIGEMSEEEVLNALEVEAGSRRRGVILDKLIQKAAELQRHTYIKSLKEKYKWHVPKA
jgi:hypothetical protein